ncbi:MAG: dipeptidyl aminopeptidase/acylaminoacyl peptidase [Pseudohongiellaceae bacterium]|jgi:dipeptidyl aminopeptidase/acylaminoacyl peptidase
MTNVFIRLLGLGLFISSSWLSAAPDSQILQNIDVFELEVAAEPQISPSGEQIVYVRQSYDIMTDRQRSNLWIVGIDGNSHRPLLSGTDSYTSPRWSPSGDRIAYISSAEGRGPQLYVRWMDTAQTALLSNIQESPANMSWAPDGQSLAFTAFVGSEVKPLATAPQKPEGANWAPPVKVIETLNYRSDGRGYLDPGHTQVFVIPAEGGTPRQLSQGEYNHGGGLSWAADGSSLVISSNRNEGWELAQQNSDLWAIDVATAQMTQLTTRNGPDTSPQVSPDGRHLAFLGYEDKKMGYHNRTVSVMDLDDGSISEISDDLDRSVDSIAWSSSTQLIVSYDDFGKKTIATLSLEGDLQILTRDAGGADISRPYTSGSFSVANNGRVAYTAGTSQRPADVGYASRRGVEKLTGLNEDLLAHKTLGAVEEISWRSSVGDHEVWGWIVTPPNFDPTKKYPFILEIHGGPFTAYGPHFSAEVQLYAAAGYVVLYTNPRGSTSYGYTFANEIHHAYPGQDYDDLMSGVDEVLERGYVDESQLFVTGGSGGGVLTAWIIGNTDRFAAAAVAKPVINWASMALYSDIPETVASYWFEKPPWEDYQTYWQRSPLSLVGNVVTPTLLLTGESDMRTPMPESEQYYQALKLQGIDSALVRVPESSHGIASRPSNLIAKVDNILAWFERYRTDLTAD